MILDLYDLSGGRYLGSASLLADTFPEGAGNIPAAPQATYEGPGYFDLSALRVDVSPGQLLSFVLRPGSEPGVCDLVSFLCSAGRVGSSCSSNLDCNAAMRVGTNSDFYPYGAGTIIGGFPFGFDVAFKVIELTPPEEAVSLTWSGPIAGFDVHRSEDPATVSDPTNIIGVAGGRAFVDNPPPARLWCYEVRTRVQVDAFVGYSYGTVPVGPGEVPGQTFDIVTSGQLMGIEIAPQNQTPMAGDTLILDLFSEGGALLASAAISAEAFPSGPVPELQYSTVGPGYFDLSSFDLTVSQGDALSFSLRPGFGPGVCNTATHLCTSGRVGAACSFNAVCNRFLHVGIGFNDYSGGTAISNGEESPNEDLAFKTRVLP